MENYKITKSIKTLALLSAFITSSAFAIDLQSTISNNSERAAFYAKYDAANNGALIVDNLRSGLLAYYARNGFWPANIIALVNEGYVATIKMPWGADIVGVPSANSFSLKVDGQRKEMATTIAGRTGGVINGNIVSVIVPVPASTSIGNTMLSRGAVSGKPEANTMATDLNLGGFSLNNVNEANVVLMNVGTGNITDSTINNLEVTTSFDVIPDATFRRNVNVLGNIFSTQATHTDVITSSLAADTMLLNGILTSSGEITTTKDVQGRNIIATNKVIASNGIDTKDIVISGLAKANAGEFNDVNISNRLIANNADVSGVFRALSQSEFIGDALFRGSVSIDGGLTVLGIASAFDIRENGSFLKDKYLGIDAKAKDAEKLDGVDSIQFARRDANNTFAGSSTFTNAIAANGGVIVDGKTVISSDGNTLYEGGVALSGMYLGLNAKAKDADKLDGVDSIQFARRDANNTFAGSSTFTNAIAANGGVIVDGKTVVSGDGNTLYENGIALDKKYLGINAKAKDADKLDGIDSTQFARRDIDPNFTSNVTVSGRVYAKNGVHVQGDWLRVDGSRGVYFQSYGGGWYMTDSTWLRGYGNKSLLISGVVRADGGIQVDGKTVASSDGSTLYENNVALVNKYLGKTAKSADSDKLDGVNSTQFARRDTANSFAQTNTFNGIVDFNGVAYFDGALNARRGFVGTGAMDQQSTARFRSTVQFDNAISTKAINTTGNITVTSGDVRADGVGLKSTGALANNNESRVVVVEQWIRDCEAQRIDVCKPTSTADDVDPTPSAGFTCNKGTNCKYYGRGTSVVTMKLTPDATTCASTCSYQWSGLKSSSANTISFSADGGSSTVVRIAGNVTLRVTDIASGKYSTQTKAIEIEIDNS